VFCVVFALSLGFLGACTGGSGDRVVDDGENGDGDEPPPTDVADLAVVSVTPISVNLRWSAPSCGGSTDPAFDYDLRYSLTPITDAGWASATQAANEPTPLAPGTRQSAQVVGLAPAATYSIALKSRNADGDWSRLSNVVSAILPPEEPVAFPDSSFEALIREALAKPVGEIHSSELAGVMELEGDGRGIREITGIEQMKALRFLHLRDNEIHDLAPLAGLLDLRSLGLDSNGVTDIAPLAALVYLTQLGLGSNAIADLHPLAGLTSLELLNLSGNEISDLMPLGRMHRLSNLNLSANQIANIIVLGGLPALSILNLDQNQITGLGPLLGNEGLGQGDRVTLFLNPLLEETIRDQIPVLQARGVTVLW
jgi:Leucine-rich repeat (LRR) protein